MSLFAELKRRHVYRVAVAYAVVGWLLIEIATQVFPVFHIPDWAAQLVVLLIAIGFPIAVVLAWAFEMTPEGVRRTEPADSPEARAPEHTYRIRKHLNAIIIGVLVLAVVVLLWRQFAPRGPEAMPTAAATATSEKQEAKPSAITTDHSIAVLPFVNMSSDKEQDYFSDGLSEELLNQLAQVPQLRVIARTSSFSFKGREVDAATIAKTLNVANILEGSVRKSGDKLRITAQLVRASDSSHLWSHTYDRELADVFKVQDEISREVVAALKIRLLPTQQIANTQRTRDPAAYEQYLIGIKYQKTGGQPAAQLSVEAFRRAITTDPAYANAYAALSLSQATLSDFAESPARREIVIQESLAAADMAIKLAPDLPDGYAGRGNTRYRMRWNWSGAQSDFQRALVLDPNDVATLSYYGTLLFALGHRADGLDMLRKATVADPLSELAWTGLGRHLASDGQVEAAREALQRSIKIKPDQIWGAFLLGNLELAQGKTDIAMANYALAPDQFRLTGTAMAQFTRGDKAASDQAMATLESQYAIGFAFQIAQAHAWRGEKDQAFNWLDRAYDLHDAGMTRLTYDPALDPLRDDPRFAALVKKMDFPE